MSTIHPSSFFRRRCLILGLWFCVGVVCITTARHSSSTLFQATAQPSAKETRDRILTVIRDTISRGQGTLPDGTKFWTRVPPTSEAVSEVLRYGDRAIPALEEYIWKEGAAEASVALGFLGRFRGSQIVGPLKRIVEENREPSLRDVALRLLTQAPSDLALPIFRKAAETDSDPKVREVARVLMVKYSPQGR